MTNAESGCFEEVTVNNDNTEQDKRKKIENSNNENNEIKKENIPIKEENNDQKKNSMQNSGDKFDKFYPIQDDKENNSNR